MIDFKKLAASKKTAGTKNPREIFDRLPKPENIVDLHDSQAKVLDNWFKNRNKKDTVIKLNTGGGKTLVGLLVAVSSARELGRGALYLVETKQLAHQVYEQARAIGIDVVEYAGKASLTASFRNGQAVLVAPYQALFNGLSVFGTLSSREPEEVSAIIIDDAHSSFDIVRNAFTTSVYANDDTKLFKRLCAPFRRAFESIDRQNTFDDFMSGADNNTDEVLEVPFWAWLDNASHVASLISKKRQTDSGDNTTASSIRFTWPLIKDDLKYCQATLSRDAFSITPYLPLIEKFPTFTNASRRIYMSATFADDSAIIRTFGCKKGDLNVIAPSTLAGVGRKMILMIGDGDSTRKTIVSKMQKLAANGQGAVVLEPSFVKARQWEPYGAKVIHQNEVPDVVKSLRSGTLQEPVVFANRYNGLDLPDKACRLLVVSGIPTGMSDSQRLLSNTLFSSRIYARIIAQNIEQAIGRGTRGSGDYCVVVLFGRDLCEWVLDERHLKYFSLATQAQIMCGKEFMSDLDSVDTLNEVIDQGVSDDQGFAFYLTNFMADYVEDHNEPEHDVLEEFATVERKAFRAWREGHIGSCVKKLVSYSKKEGTDNWLGGFALHLAAQAEYANKQYVHASQLQERAHNLNRSLSKASFSLPEDNASGQATTILNLIERLENKGCDAVSIFMKETASLSGQSCATDYEIALEALGKYLGAISERVDKNGNGPDVVWIFKDEGIGFAIEVKNEKKPSNPLTKEEHGQLLVAGEWLRSKYSDVECIPISVHPNDLANDNASATNSLVLTLEQIANMRDAVCTIIDSLVRAPKNQKDRLAQCDDLFNSERLLVKQIIRNRATHFRVQN